MPRFFCPTPLAGGQSLELPASAARHVQVLRLQPGEAITLFDGLADPSGVAGEYAAIVTHMGRSSVTVQVGPYLTVERAPTHQVHLVVGMPANERMDWLVEKATELGVASITPLVTERSVLRLHGERADKKQVHWQSVAIAACEQCGGNRVPVIHGVSTLAHWLSAQSTAQMAHPTRFLLSLRSNSTTLSQALARPSPARPQHDQSLDPQASSIQFLSGPEGGLSQSEEVAALATGFQPVTLGPRVLRAETAALFALATVLS